ncbi:hypothetical protein ACFVUS_09460 [Nocardia sp. NPDC058058]|uniref:hypothetical protein n=1 Tax=Nocardia sp. NPDC058058 TaxID=3346317 RepID=UPI0036DCFE33
MNDTHEVIDDVARPAADESDPAPGAAVPAGEPSADLRRTRRLSRRTVLFAAAAVVLTGAAIAHDVYTWVRSRHAEDLVEAREAARKTACEYGPVLANYDVEHLDTYFAAVLDHATGDWKREFDSTSKDLRDVLVQGQVKSKSGTVDCAISASDANTAAAVVVIDQSVTSVGTQGQPRRGQLAITLSLVKSGDRWLVDKVSSPLLRTQ